MKTLPPRYLSDMCLEFRLMLRAGIATGEWLTMFLDKRGDRYSRALSVFFRNTGGDDMPLSEKLGMTDLFPRYFIETLRLGEASGKLDEALSGLSDYYNKRAGLSDRLHGALFYPVILFLALAAVMIVLLTRVLPVFDEIYAQLGAEMTPLAVSLLNAGKWLMSAQAVIFAAVAVMLAAGAAVCLIPPVRRSAERSFETRFGDKGVFGRVTATKFTSAMSMAVSSGLDPIEAMDLAEAVCRSSDGMCGRIDKCREYLKDGEPIEDCFKKASIFPESDGRLFSLGLNSGSAGDAMKELARRSEEKVTGELDGRLEKLGPAMILAVCVIVGLTLVAVMLPTIGILSSLV